MTTRDVKAGGRISSRSYDASGRRQASARRRERIIRAARERFLADGYGATTMAAVADDAGVSVETVYKTFRNKPGLVRAVWERALEGSAATPAEERADAVSATATDPRLILHNWATLAAEVAAVAGPVFRLVRAAAESDPAAAELYAEVEAGRADRMAHNAAYLLRGGHLREGLGADHARDILTAMSVALHEPLVERGQWSAEEYSELIYRLLCAALLPDPPTQSRGVGSPSA